MKFLFFLLITLVALFSSVDAFRTPFIGKKIQGANRLMRYQNLKLSMAEERADVESLKARMANDPDFDPLQDPSSLKILETLIPPESQDALSAIQRLKSVIDAEILAAGDADILQERASRVEDKKESLISTPQSAWVKGGCKDDDDDGISADERQKLMDELKAAYPLILQ